MPKIYSKSRSVIDFSCKTADKRSEILHQLNMVLPRVSNTPDFSQYEKGILEKLYRDLFELQADKASELKFALSDYAVEEASSYREQDILAKYFLNRDIDMKCSPNYTSLTTIHHAFK